MVDYHGAGKYAGSVAAITLAAVGIRQLLSWFQENQQAKLQHTEDIYANSQNGRIAYNTNGVGQLVAKNYKGSDGATYQLCADNNWYKLSKSGSAWERIT